MKKSTMLHELVLSCQAVPHGQFYCTDQSNTLLSYQDNLEPERVVRVANRDHRGVIWSADPPLRHHHLFRVMEEHGRHTEATLQHAEQGFLTNHGRYVDRTSARIIAVACRQLSPRAMNHKELYSEDVW